MKTKTALFSILFMLVFLCISTAYSTPLALTPSINIDISTGTGVGNGHVDTGHIVFDFNALSGDILDLDIDVTKIFAGTTYTDDDSKLFLFDSSGVLLAENDDDGFSGESFIDDYAIIADGIYYAAVTTYDNDPIFSGGIISGWEDDGESSFDFNIIITNASPVPEPSTMLLFGIGLISLAGVNRRK